MLTDWSTKSVAVGVGTSGLISVRGPVASIVISGNGKLSNVGLVESRILTSWSNVALCPSLSVAFQVMVWVPSP